MSIRFNCPACNASLKMPDASVGKKGHCPKCGQRLYVPPPMKSASPRNHTMLVIPAKGDAFVEIDHADSSNSSPETEKVSAAPISYLYEEHQSSRMPPGTKFGFVALGIMLLATGIVGATLAVKMNSNNVATEDRHLEIRRRRQTLPEHKEQKSSHETFEEVESKIESFFVRLIVFAILYLLFWLLILAWVARDAKNRCIDGGAVWVIVIFFTSFIGLLVYIASRPHGVLSTCGRCHNRKLNYALICPHCGQSNP